MKRAKWLSSFLWLISASVSYAADISMSADSPVYVNQDYTVGATTDYPYSDGILRLYKNGNPAGEGYHYYNFPGGVSGTFQEATPGPVQFDATFSGFDGDFGSNSITVTVEASSPFVVEQASANNVQFGQATTLRAQGSSAGSGLRWVEFYATGPGMSDWTHVGRVSVGAGNVTATLTWTPPSTGNYTVGASGTAAQPPAPQASGSFTVAKATPAIAPGAIKVFTTVHTVTAADLTGAFANPYSGNVTLPTGNISYTLVSGGSGPITVGTVLIPGTYGVQITYAGDSNYEAVSPTVTWMDTLGEIYNYDDAGRLTSTTRANGLNHTYSLDEEASLLSVTHSSADTTYFNGPGNGIGDWWELAHFGAPDSDPLATPAGDGISNIMKYMLGKSPGTVLSGSLVAAALQTYSGNSYIYFTYAVAKDSANSLYMQQSADNGATWQSGGAYFATMSVSDLGDGTQEMVVRCLTPAPAFNSLRFRLKADGGSTGIVAYGPSFSGPAGAALPGDPIQVPAMPGWVLAGLGVLFVFIAGRFLRSGNATR